MVSRFYKGICRINGKFIDSLKGRNTKWTWTNEMETEFGSLKNVLRNLGKLKIADYDKEFLLKTDASNIGMGEVLLQENSKGEWVPVQWASKKFTPT